VEIHGNARPKSADCVEVAVSNLPIALLSWFKAAFQEQLDARWPAASAILMQASGPEAGAAIPPRLRVLVEGIDNIFFTASGARSAIFSKVSSVLHIELPAALREKATRQVVVDALSVILEQLQTKLSLDKT
jgi:hypothetical protein